MVSDCYAYIPPQKEVFVLTKIKVAICDDFEYICRYFKSEIDAHDDMECVGCAYDRAGCIKMVSQNKPDILLLDIQMETKDTGILLIPEVLEESPETKIIIITIHENDDFIFKALTLGAVDYIIKTTPIDELIDTIRAVYHNTKSLSPKIAQKILRHCETISNRNQSILYMFNLMRNLTTAEFEVLSDFYYGLSYEEISKKRVVEESTLRSQVSKIIKKLDAPNMKTLIKDLHAMNAFEIFSKKN